MVSGHLSEKKGHYYAVITYKDGLGNRKTKWIATGLPVKGNKKRAEAFLNEQKLKADINRSTFYIPVIITVTKPETDIRERLMAGASILNIAGGSNTPELVEAIRADFPDVPIIASGGNTEENIKKTIQAGANAITYTPPSTGELFKSMMEKYRND